MKKAKILLMLFAGIVATNASAETVTYYATDQLGSPIAAMDSSGSLLWWESYNPYGEKRRSPSSANGDTGYTGHQHDSATGLTYMQARYYDPVIGRFLANDPVGFAGHLNGTQGAQGFNRYAYVNNNPYKYTDPDGRAGALLHPGTWVAAAIVLYTVSDACGNPCKQAQADSLRGLGDMIDSLFNEVSESSEGAGGGEELSDSESADGDEKESKQREKGDRWSSGQDAEEQFRDIDAEQRRRRSGGDNTSINSTEKSRQRADNALKPHEIDLDNLDEY